MALHRLSRASVALGLLMAVAGCSHEEAPAPGAPPSAAPAPGAPAPSTCAPSAPGAPAPSCPPSAPAPGAPAPGPPAPVPGAPAPGAPAPAAPTPGPAPAPQPSPPKPAKNYIFGQISHIKGDIWTVSGIKGNTYTVRVSSLTVFGDLFNAAKRNDFRVGDHIRVAGVFVGTTVNATAIDYADRPPRR